METAFDVHHKQHSPAMTVAFTGDVVVGVDGRPEGWDSLALGERLATLAGSRLVVVAAYPFAPLSARLLDGPTDADGARKVLAGARRALGELEAELCAVAGSSPGRTLHEVAEACHANVIVVGSSHHGPLGRLVLGGVTAEALRRAPVAVAVAPRGWARGPRSLARIGIAVDGSARDASATAFARQVAAHLRPPGTVQTIHVAPPHGRGAVVSADVQLEGEVADALAAYSGEVDLLVLGSRGLDRIRAVVLGSVAARLVALARCPVLVLPADMPGRSADDAVEVAPAA